jgi:hypothetical protein
MMTLFTTKMAGRWDKRHIMKNWSSMSDNLTVPIMQAAIYLHPIELILKNHWSWFLEGKCRVSYGERCIMSISVVWCELRLYFNEIFDIDQAANFIDIWLLEFVNVIFVGLPFKICTTEALYDKASSELSLWWLIEQQSAELI